MVEPIDYWWLWAALVAIVFCIWMRWGVKYHRKWFKFLKRRVWRK